MESNIQAILKVLDPLDNTTGGGTASSVAGAMAAGLTAMVARLSLGKISPELDQDYEKIAERGGLLAEALFNGGREDSEAFAKVSAAYKMPKNSDKEKSARSEAIQKGMIYAAEVPLKNAIRCREILDLSQQLTKKYNTNAASDLDCAQNLAHAGLMGCVANVRINIPYIKDEKICREFESRLEKILRDIQTNNI